MKTLNGLSNTSCILSADITQ